MMTMTRTAIAACLVLGAGLVISVTFGLLPQQSPQTARRAEVKPDIQQARRQAMAITGALFSVYGSRELPDSLDEALQNEEFRVKAYPLFGSSTDGASHTALLDPWSRPFMLRSVGRSEWIVYSAGPNRRDEYGAGDDVSVEY